LNGVDVLFTMVSTGKTEQVYFGPDGVVTTGEADVPAIFRELLEHWRDGNQARYGPPFPRAMSIFSLPRSLATASASRRGKLSSVVSGPERPAFEKVKP